MGFLGEQIQQQSVLQGDDSLCVAGIFKLPAGRKGISDADPIPFRKGKN